MVTLRGVATFSPGTGLQGLLCDKSMRRRHMPYKYPDGMRLVFTGKCSVCPASGHSSSLSFGGMQGLHVDDPILWPVGWARAQA